MDPVTDLGKESNFPEGGSLLGTPKSSCDSKIEWEVSTACQIASELWPS